MRTLDMNGRAKKAVCRDDNNNYNSISVHANTTLHSIRDKVIMSSFMDKGLSRLSHGSITDNQRVGGFLCALICLQNQFLEVPDLWTGHRDVFPRDNV